MNLENILQIVDMDFYLFKNLSKDVFVYRFRNIFGGLKELYPNFKKQIEERINYNLNIYYPEEKSLNELAKEKLNKLADDFEKFSQEGFESEADKIVEDVFNSQSSKSFKPEWETPKMNINSTLLRDDSVKDRNDKISEDDLTNLEIALNSAKTFEEFLNLV